MAEKILNTRIALKYDTLTNWNASSLILKAGEVAFAVIETANVAAGEHPPVMFKVGDGSKTFSQLGWGAATAADIYAWAKQNKIDIQKAGTGNVVASIAWDATANGGKGGLKYETASVATAEGMAGLQEALEALTEKVNGMYTNEQIDQAINDAIEALEEVYQPIGNYKTKQTAVEEKGAANKTLKISQDTNGEITVKEEAISITSSQVTDLDATVGAKYATKTEAQGYANTAKSEVIGASGDAADADTIYGAKAAAKAAQDAADAAQETIDNFLTGDGIDPETIETLKEIQDAIADNKEATELITGKADKVTGATSGNFAGLDANGNLTDSGKKATDFEVAGAAAAAQTAAEGKAQELVDALANGAVKDNTNAINTINNTLEAIILPEGVTPDGPEAIAVHWALYANESDKAINDGDGNSITDTYATKKELSDVDMALSNYVYALTTDNIEAGEEIWVFDCGNASDKLN